MTRFEEILGLWEKLQELHEECISATNQYYGVHYRTWQRLDAIPEDDNPFVPRIIEVGGEGIAKVAMDGIFRSYHETRFRLIDLLAQTSRLQGTTALAKRLGKTKAEVDVFVELSKVINPSRRAKMLESPFISFKEEEEYLQEQRVARGEEDYDGETP